ncbi:MAG: hypothetical protein H7258_12845 [Ferruginibacter sp.]|nr:hypothetical protein [Ferruginibacter sp.]
MKKIVYLIIVVLFLSCNENQHRGSKEELDKIAADYVKLGLEIGRYDGDFVDAYYGPDSLKPATAKLEVFPKFILLNAVKDLTNRLLPFTGDDRNKELALRAGWMTGQLQAFTRRIKIFSGEYKSFDEESRDLFGVVAPIYPESHYQKLVTQLDALLPGTGTTAEKFQQLANHFIIPKNKLDTVFKTAIAESRKRTLAHYKLPANENFTLEYVTGKPWSGYNWYKGNYQSDIQVNTDTDMFIERAIDVASHESYPGHHVYNMLLEKKLYRDKGWLEISLYPLFSPQSLIAEGSANYGIDVAFPGNEKSDFARDVLLPLAGMDTAGLGIYFDALRLKGNLNFVRNEVGRGLLDNIMSETEALRWLMQYGLNNKETALKSISFIKKYRSYVINYNYGLQLVKDYIESNGGTASATNKRWKLFEELLSNEVTPQQLIKGKKL